MAYLDDNGLLYLWNKIKTLVTNAVANKVDKVSGKGLSTNDYTTTEKNKLAGVASGAEVNQNAFSHVLVGGTTLSADQKLDVLTLEAGSNVTLTPDAATDKVTITSTNTTYNPATGSSAGLMSAADKAKLDGVETGANKYVHLTTDGNLHVPATGTTNNGKALIAGSTAGTFSWQALTKSMVGLGSVDNTSDLNKPISTATQNALDGKFKFGRGKIEDDDLDTLYDQGKFGIYITGSGVENGPVSGHPVTVLVCIANYKSTQLCIDDNKFYIRSRGVGATTWDAWKPIEHFTTEEKTKLSGIAANANNYVHPSTHPANMIVEDTTHRFITDVQRDTWNAKVDKQAGKGLSTNDYTTTEKNKLAAFGAASTYALKADIVGMYKYKGSVADASKLPTTGQTTGDVYNIVAPSIYGAAGANVAWDGSKWDSLGEIFTITSITNAQIDTICA
jgi:hypothetical protein|nr:MAG TPA: Head fiber protein [Caudoviricetes sp.]